MLERAWYENAWWLLLLLPLSWLFMLVVQIRRFLYEHDFLSRPALPVPVIVVGNISVGGTGKTPVVAWLVDELTALGYQPGIVSRGYGGGYDGKPRLVSADDDAGLVGDEPLLLASHAKVPVCISKDRPAGVLKLAEAGVNVIVADDGLQHYRMRRDIELVVVDGARGFGNGFCLPAGPLRENVTRLGGVDALLLNGASKTIDGHVFRLAGSRLVNLASKESRELSEFNGVKVSALAGIGHPQRFYQALEAAGMEVEPVPVRDHGSVDLKALAQLTTQPIVMTEKDAVKYRSEPPRDAWFLPVKAEFSGQDAATIMDLIKAKLA